MTSRTIGPLSQSPRTIETLDRLGKPRFAITARELTPERAKLATAARRGMLVLAAIAGYVAYSSLPNATDGHIAGIAAVCLLGWCLLSALIATSLRRKTRIVVTTEFIRVGRWYGWQQYDRNIEHRFVLLMHDGAQKEYLRNDLETRQAASKGRVIQKPVFYGESFHVALIYAGHRIDLLTVFDRARATAVVARLQYCDRRLTEAAGVRERGVGSDPQTEWTHMPGGIRQ